MKSKKKIFSIILALVMAVGVLSVPTIAYNKVSAEEQANDVILSASTLTVEYDKFNEKFNVTDKNEITFIDYLTGYPTDSSDQSTYNVYVSLWAPDGTTLMNFEKVDEDTKYNFSQPGLYAVMFKKDSGSDYPAIFSKQYYVAVENSIEEIVLTEKLSETAKTGSYVEIPECSTTNVTIKVFSPYGENVPYNSGKFTNLSNVLGTYYIEYSKTIQVDGKDVKQYKYLTITFGDSYAEPTTTEIKKEEAKVEEEEDYLLLGGLKEADEKGVLYLFKPYLLNDIKVKNEQGEMVKITEIPDATVAIKCIKNIDSVDTAFYYDLSNGGDQTQDEVSNALSDMSYDEQATIIFRELEGIDTITDSGTTFEIIYKSESLGFEKKITATSKIDSNAFAFECEKVFKDVILVEEEDDLTQENDINVYTLPECKVSILNGNSEDDYRSFLSADGVQVEVYFTDANGNKVEFSEAGEGVEYTIAKIDNGGSYSYKIDFSKLSEKAKEGKFSYELVVKYSIDYEISETITGTLSKTYTSHLATEYNDDRKPTALTIGSYDNMIVIEDGSTAQFTFPTASASDVDNDGNKTNGVDISIVYRQTNSAETMVAKVGDTVDLQVGSYIVTYVFTDSMGNAREQSFYIKVCNESRVDIDTSAINIIDARVSYKEDENKYSFTINDTNVTNVLVYKEGCELSSPSSISIVDGKVASFDVVADENFVAVLNGRTSIVDVYTSLSYNGKHLVDNVKPYSYNMPTKSSILVANEYASISAKVGDRILFLQEAVMGFSVETENGKYYIENENEIVINYPGKYTIKNIQNGIETIVTAYESSVADVNYFLNMKQVVSSKDAEADRTIEVRAPYVEGYFGHSMVANVSTSDGIPVEVKDGKFVVSKTDNYNVVFSFNYLSGTKDITTVVSSGEIIKPQISISSTYQNIIWTGEANKVYLIDASATDKFGTSLTNIVVNVYDKFGKSVEIKKDADNKAYVEVTEAGIYSVYYSVTDEDGFTSTKQVSFMVLYDDVTDEKGLSGWAIAGIVVGSVVVAGLVALLVVIVLLKKKGKDKFINKSRQAKKAKKVSDEKEYSSALYTIVQSKNESEWTAKKNNRVIAKTSSKEEAIAKINEDGEGQKKIKVYNKQGRLIDTID